MAVVMSAQLHCHSTRDGSAALCQGSAVVQCPQHPVLPCDHLADACQNMKLMQCSGLLCLRDSILGVPSSRVTHQTDMKKQCLFWDVLCSVIFPLQKLLLGNESSNRYLSSYCAVSCKDFSPFLSHFSSFKTCTVFSHCYYWHFCLAAMLGLVLEQKKCIGRYESAVSKG